MDHKSSLTYPPVADCSIWADVNCHHVSRSQRVTIEKSFAMFLTRSNELKHRGKDRKWQKSLRHDVLGGWLVGLVILHVFVVTQFKGLSDRGDDIQRFIFLTRKDMA